MKSAFDRFKQLMFAHAVDRSPHAVQIFTLEDVERVTEFMLNSYFRHFKLYQYIFTTKLQVPMFLPFQAVSIYIHDQDAGMLCSQLPAINLMSISITERVEKVD